MGRRAAWSWLVGGPATAALLFAAWTCSGSALPRPAPHPGAQPAVGVEEPPTPEPTASCPRLLIAQRLWVGFFSEMKLKQVQEAREHALSIVKWLDHRCLPGGGHPYDAERNGVEQLQVLRIEFCDGSLERARVVLDAAGSDSGSLAFWMIAGEGEPGDANGFRLGAPAALPPVHAPLAPEPVPAGCAAR